MLNKLPCSTEKMVNLYPGNFYITSIKKALNLVDCQLNINSNMNTPT